MGNCGVTFAPVRTEDIVYLAEVMESVEDIPREAILEGLPWDWRTFGEYLEFLDRLPKRPKCRWHGWARGGPLERYGGGQP